MNDNTFSGVMMSPSLIGRGSPVKETSENIYRMAKLLTGVPKIEKQSLHKDLDLIKFKNKKGQTALDYWRENIGKVTVNGLKIEQYMKIKMRSSEFINAGTGDPEDEGGKEYLMKSYYKAFRDAAKKKLLDNGSMFRNEEDGSRLSDSFYKERNGKYKYFKNDAPHIKKDKKRKIDRLIGF